MGVDRESIYSLLRDKMEYAGFVFEKEQQPHSQNRRDKELKFIHPALEDKFVKLGISNRAKKYYIKPLSEDDECEIGLTTGKTSPLFNLGDFPLPNAVDTFNNTKLNAWVNRENESALDSLLYAIKKHLAPTLTDIEELFNSAIKQSISLSSKERKDRLKTAPKKPEKILVQAIAYKRNPDVVAEVLDRAQGHCEQCKSKAPFTRRRDWTPYLEVHHIVQLSQDGDDTVENAIALCPNCHREQHFG